MVQTSQILELLGSLVAVGLKERLKTQLQSGGFVLIQQKQRSDHSVAVRVSLSRLIALIMNTLLGTSQREGFNLSLSHQFCKKMPANVAL